MALIIWSDKYSVGVAKFDDQHKQLVALLNELQQTISPAGGPRNIGQVLEELAEKTDRHFAAEEGGLDQYCVPGLPAHRLEHDRLRAQVKRFATGLTSGNVAVSSRVLDFLRSWLMDHIQNCDKRYSPYLQDKAL